jgi:salicylate biosynthesis isochorismate synthase/menaquinone-specific isochorismate synthase
MSFTRTRADSPFELSEEAAALLAQRVERAVERSRREHAPALAAVTVPVDAGLDLSAAVLAARRADDRFFCFEQPDRDGFVLAGLGCAQALESRGPGRFSEVAVRARDLGRRAYVDDPAEDPRRPAAAGPVFVGGFAFAENGGQTPEWSSLAPASLVLPELSLTRHRGEARMTVCVLVHPDRAHRLNAVLDRVAEPGAAHVPLIDPDPVQPTRVASAAPPSHYEQAVERAVERIQRGELEKIVLAREVRAHAPSPPDPGAVLGALRDVFPACFCWCVGTPELAFVGASPELLVRRDGGPDAGTDATGAWAEGGRV